jgi:protocatechuate 3,4-dioxygenase beta subunit
MRAPHAGAAPRARHAAAAAALAAAIAMAGVGACESDGHPQTAATSTAGPTPSATSTAGRTPNEGGGTAGCPAPPVRPVAAGASLTLGPINGMDPSSARGDRLVVEAVVLDSSCAPAAAASVRVWHTDARGLYGPAGTQACCYYGGTVRTDANGRFRLDTIRPAQYPDPGAPPAHIHLDIRHRTGALETEILFGTGQQPPALIRPSHTVPAELRSTGPASWYAQAAFVIEA